MADLLVKSFRDLRPRDGMEAAVQAGGRNPQLDALVPESGRYA